MNKHIHKKFMHAEPVCPMSAGHVNKRTFIKAIGALLVAWVLGLLGLLRLSGPRYHDRTAGSWPAQAQAAATSSPAAGVSRLGVDLDGRSSVYLARGGTPEKNMVAVLAALGGIRKLIGPQDIVILKPNSQWWNQGMTNTNAMKAFMEEVLSIPKFSGEIIICDNHQFQETNARGWTTEQRNGDYNYNELVEHFQSRGHRNVTKYHWQCAGPNPNPLQGDAANLSKRVAGPEDGDGYVWREDIVYHSPLGRKCMLTYPIFTSSYSGTTIDLKEGAWKEGAYTGQPVKLINFSALNFHGPYVGFTGAVKNFMGVVDMTCGFQSPVPRRYYNTHYIGLRQLKIPFSEMLPWRIQNAIAQYNYKYFCHTGAVLARFMIDIKKPDLNIITAHWVGYGSRTNTTYSGYPKAILASTDPVALDYIASKEILLPLTRSEATELHSDWDSLPYVIKMNDVTDHLGPSYRFLESCHEQGVGNLDPVRIEVIPV